MDSREGVAMQYCCRLSTNNSNDRSASGLPRLIFLQGIDNVCCNT